MRLKSRLFLLSMLLPAALSLGAAAGAQTAQPGAPATMKMDVPAAPAGPVTHAMWSDPKAWADGKVPVAGEAVTIPANKDIVLDVAPAALRSLTIEGKLSFSDAKDLELKTDWIYLPGGELDIGSEAKPHTRKATITLTDNVPDENINTMGDRGIMLLKGTLSLHGDRKNAWTKLSATAKAGSNTIQVLDASGWRKGDMIALASTDFDADQAERRTIASVSGNVIKLDKPLQYMHFGRITDGVDERGEVGLLTRNIKIQASEDSEKTYFGGHIMAMSGSKMYLSSIELNRMGQNLHLARYPVHWHIEGDGQGQYIENSAIHDTYSRCVTVHGTNNLRIQNNVTFNTVGHCYFMEDAVETGNKFIHNLGMLTKCHPDGKPCVPTNLGPLGTQATGKYFDTTGQDAKNILLHSDNTAATFWITNPDNVYRDNVAAGSESTGFWYALPQNPTGAFDGNKTVFPRRLPVLEFVGNTAHSNFDGFMSDRGPTADGHFRVGSHVALENPADGKSPPVVTVIKDLTSYKNRNSGVWTRGEMDVFEGYKSADNGIGYTHATALSGHSAFTSRVQDSLFVGESANVGNPTTPAEKAYGRSLPEPELADFPIRGYEFYDYRHELDNVTFVNFQDNATRKTGAISYLLFTSFSASNNNNIERAKFINAKPVYFPPMNPKWGNDNDGMWGYKGAVFHDVDGSVTGVKDSTILNNDDYNDIAIDKTCEIKPTWNAAVCTGDVGRVTIDGGISNRPGGPRNRERGAKPKPPITLTRVDNGNTVVMGGMEANIRAGTEIKVTSDRPTLDLHLTELDKGSWVLFELPGFDSAVGKAENSLDAVRKSDVTAYYKDKDTLWVKVVSNGEGARIAGPDAGGTELEASRPNAKVASR